MNGNGSMAFDWSWIVALLIIAGIFGNGFGWGGNRGNVANDTLLGEEFIKRDIFNTNQNVSATSCQTQRDVLENRFNCSQNACATQKEILQNRYDTSLGLANVNKDILLGNQNLQAQLSNCCCDLKTAIHAEGEATRNMMQQDKIDQLREQVNASNLALFGQTLVNQILPRSIPAYPSCSPYVPVNYNGCACGTSLY